MEGKCMNLSTNFGVLLVLLGAGLAGMTSGVVYAEVPPIDAVHVEHIETATFSMG